MKRTVVWFNAVFAGVLVVGMNADSMFAVQENSDSGGTDSLRPSAGVKNEIKEDSCSHPELRDELAKRVQLDQAARSELIEAVYAQEKAGENKSVLSQLKMIPVITKLGKIDQQNREWLEQPIDKHGWPGKSKVGKSDAHDAWLWSSTRTKMGNFKSVAWN